MARVWQPEWAVRARPSLPPAPRPRLRIARADVPRMAWLGIAFSLVAAVAFAIYLIGFERAGRAYDAFTTSARSC